MATAAALVALAACQKTEIAPEDNSAPAAEVPGDATLFSASLEAPVSASTRMTIEDGAGNQKVPTWEAGDQIKIFYLDPSTSTMTSTLGTATQAGAETTFSATVPESVTTFYAVYPASLTSSVDADGKFSVSNKISEMTFSNACICIAKCGAEKNFAFKNLCSILKFTIGTRGSQAPQIMSLDATPIVGTINASLNAVGEVVYDATTPYESTAYNRDYNNIPTGASDYVCYVPVLPQAQASGLAINWKETYKMPAVFAEVSIPFERSHIYNLGTIDSKVVTDYYITPNGSGTKDGKSLANAGDVNTFKSLVSVVAGDPSSDNAVKCARYAQIWRTKGTTFHFGAGTYVFGDASNDRLTIDFNGANGSVYSEFSIEGADPDGSGNNTTIFSGNDQYGILNVFDRARVHIDNITFANAKGTADLADDTDINTVFPGAALFMKAQTSGIKAAPRVWLTHCVFDGNKTAPASSTHTYEGGSAINMTHGGLYADHCIFRDNYDNKRNGCIRLSGNNNFSSEVSYAFFNACLWTGNRVAVYNANAGAVIRHYRKGALLGLYNCTFYNNNGSNPTKKGWIELRLDRAAIIANTAIIDDLYVTGESQTAAGYPIHIPGGNMGNNHYIFANNILMNTNAEASTAKLNRGYTLSNTSSGTHRLLMEGGNVFGRMVSDYQEGASSLIIDKDYYYVNKSNEYGGKSTEGTGGYIYSNLDNPSFADNVFKWDGTLSNGSVTCGFMSHDTMVDKVLASANINQDDSDSKVQFACGKNDASGAEKFPSFYYWLNSINAIDVDALGNARPATGWTPGAYQAQ